MAAITFSLQQAPTGVARAGQQFSVFITVSQDVSNLTFDTPIVVGGSKAGISGGASVYRLDINPPDQGSGSISVTIPEDALEGHTNPETAIRVLYNTVPLSTQHPVNTIGSVLGFAIDSDGDTLWTVAAGSQLIRSYSLSSGLPYPFQVLLIPRLLLSQPGDVVNKGLGIISGHIMYATGSGSFTRQTTTSFHFVNMFGAESDFRSWQISASACLGFSIYQGIVYIAIQRTVAGITNTFHILRRTVDGKTPNDGGFNEIQTDAPALGGVTATNEGIHVSTGDNNITILDLLTGEQKGTRTIPPTTSIIGLSQLNGRLAYATISQGATVVGIDAFVSPKASFVDSVPLVSLLNEEEIDMSIFATDADVMLFGPGFTDQTLLQLTPDGKLSFKPGSDITQLTNQLIVPFTVIDRGGFDTVALPIATIDTQNLFFPSWRDIDTILIREGETINLLKYTENADDVIFAPDIGTIPDYIDLIDNRLSIRRDSITEDQTVTIPLLARNRRSTRVREQNFRIINDVERVRNVSHNQLPVSWAINIGGIDIDTELLEEIVSISQSVEDSQINSFEPGVAVFRLDNSDGDFSVDTENNFFERNDLDITQPITEITITGGFVSGDETVSRTIFIGVIQKVSDITENSVQFQCADKTFDIRNSPPLNIGTLKSGIVLDRKRRTFHGEYDIPEQLTPVSDQSTFGISGGLPLTLFETGSLLTEGDTNPINASVDGKRLITEGNLLDSDPRVSFRSAFRDYLSEHVIDRILEYYELYDSRVFSPTINLDYQYLRSQGKPTLRSESGEPNTYPKDMLFDTTNRLIYYLFAHPSNKVNDLITTYNIDNDVVSTVALLSPSLESIQFASEDFQTFYILATNSRDISLPTPLGTYDPSELPPRQTSPIRIIELDSATGETSIFVNPIDDQRPTAATFYQMGLANRVPAAAERDFVIGDNRSPMIISDGYLYYRWQNGGSYGVARKLIGTRQIQAINTISPSVFFSQACFSFCILGSVLYVGYTDQHTDTRAIFRIDSYDISAATPLLIETFRSQLYEIESLASRVPIGVLEIFANTNGVYASVQFQKAAREV